MKSLTYVFATKEDIPLILDFIKELADYEKLLHEVVATEEVLTKNLFGEQKRAEVIFGIFEGKKVSFALFFHNFSTFLGKPGMYLEDLYVKPEFRGHGFGKQMFVFLAQIATERDCDRIDWWCLDWNKKANDFYLSLGAKRMEDWTVQRLEKSAIKNLTLLK
jgi:GNAT superfamily N-acetyltransferase